MTVKITKTFEVPFKVQGLVKTVDVSTFHQDAVEAMLTYGVRRWFQDHINSVAKAHRDNDETVDAEEIFASRLEQAESGDITVRGSGGSVDPLDKYRIAALREYMRANPDGELKGAYDAIPADDQKARREFLLSVAAKNAATVDARAKELQAIDAKKAETVDGLDIAM